MLSLQIAHSPLVKSFDWMNRTHPGPTGESIVRQNEAELDGYGHGASDLEISQFSLVWVDVPSAIGVLTGPRPHG